MALSPFSFHYIDKEHYFLNFPTNHKNKRSLNLGKENKDYYFQMNFRSSSISSRQQFSKQIFKNQVNKSSLHPFYFLIIDFTVAQKIFHPPESQIKCHGFTVNKIKTETFWGAIHLFDSSYKNQNL